MSTPQNAEMIIDFSPDTTGENELSPDQQEFIDWLNQQLEARNWQPAQLAKAAGVYQSTLGNILNGTRRLGPEIGVKIARALDLPPELVFRKAGLLPPATGDFWERDLTLQELLAIVRQMTPEERQEVLKYAIYRFRGQKR